MMRTLVVFLLLAAVSPVSAVAQTGQEAIFKLECMRSCDATIDPCCQESCTYDACLQANADTSEKADLGQIGTTIRDRSGEMAAFPYCSLHLPPLQACRAREAEAAAAARSRPAPFIDLDCCTYWAEATGGSVVVTGHMTNAAGQRYEYTSQPVHPMSQMGTAYGMFALASGVGYHVYFVDEGDPTISNGLLLIVRFADTIEIIKRARIGGVYQIRFAPDFSSATITYNTSSDPPERLDVVLE